MTNVTTRRPVASAASITLVALSIGLAALSWPSRALGAAPPSLDVRAAALIEAGTGQQLYGMNSGGELAIASTTKLMTALVTLQHTKLSEVFADPAYYPASVDSQIDLEPGERMSVHDLLIAMLLPSADDAAEDLAYNVGRRSVNRFIAMMNADARALGLEHTHYSTPIGLDTPGNYSTVSDLVALARYLLRTQPFFRRVVDLPSAVLRTGNHVRVVANLNDLVGTVPWINGVKTGHTLDAGYVLVGSGTQRGMTLISAVLGAPSEYARESDTLVLLQWGFHNFRTLTAVSAGRVIARRSVKGWPQLRADLIAAATFTHVFARATSVRTVVTAPRELTGPKPWHAVVGSVVVLANGVPVARVPLLLAHALPAAPASLMARLIFGPFTLVVLALLLGCALLWRARLRASGARRRPA